MRCRIQAAFRRLEPKAQLALAGGVVLLVVVIAVVAVTLGGGRSSEPTASPTEAGAVRTDTPSAGPAQAPGAVTSDPVPMQTAAAQTLTAENNEELAALLATTDPGGEAVAQFAAKYHGRTIEFDGNLASMSRHGDDKTRYDLLVNAGNYSETRSIGPNFQFRDVNITNDLHLTGPDIPDMLGTGDNLHIVARVGDFTDPLFFLEPISTHVR